MMVMVISMVGSETVTQVATESSLTQTKEELDGYAPPIRFPL